MKLPCIGFIFTTRLCSRGVSGFVTYCPCGVWCRGLTIPHCILLQCLSNLLINWCISCKYVSLIYIYICVCVLVPTYNRFFFYFIVTSRRYLSLLKYCVIPFPTDAILTLHWRCEILTRGKNRAVSRAKNSQSRDKYGSHLIWLGWNLAPMN